MKLITNQNQSKFKSQLLFVYREIVQKTNKPIDFVACHAKSNMIKKTFHDISWNQSGGLPLMEMEFKKKFHENGI